MRICVLRCILNRVDITAGLCGKCYEKLRGITLNSLMLAEVGKTIYLLLLSIFPSVNISFECIFHSQSIRMDEKVSDEIRKKNCLK